MRRRVTTKIGGAILFHEDFQGEKYFDENAVDPIHRTLNTENCNTEFEDTGSVSPDNATYNYGWTLTRLTDGSGYIGPKYGKFEVRDCGIPPNVNTDLLVGSKDRVRTEVSAITGSEEPDFTKEMWYSLALRFPSNGYQNDTGAHETLLQLFEKGENDIVIRAQNGRVFLEITSGDRFDLFGAVNSASVDNINDAAEQFTQLPFDKWTEFVLNIVHSKGDDGRIEVWRDGVKIQSIHQPTMYSDSLPKVKVGIYKAAYTSHPGQSTQKVRIFHVGFIKIGNDQANYDMMVGRTEVPIPPENRIPVVYAGQNRTITLPTNSILLSAVAIDVDGEIVSMKWEKLSGPSEGSIVDPTVLKPTITGLVAGTYTFRLTATDDLGATNFDDATVTVLAAIVPPITTPPPVLNGITGFKLVSASSETEVATITEGGNYSIKKYGEKLNVKVDITGTVTKVEFKLTGAMNKDTNDKAVPFSLWGDDGAGNYYYGDWNPPKIGNYTLKATPLNGEVLGTPLTINFSFVA